MRYARATVVAAACLFLLVATSAGRADDRAEKRAAALTKLRSLDDAALLDGLKKARGVESDLHLTEIVRRGGKPWIEALETLRADRERAAADPKNRDEFVFWTFRSDLELVTAIRRMSGEPDPVQVLVAGKNRRTCTMDRLPSFLVLLTNLDAKKAKISYTDGGHYRSGRQARWRFEVTDSKGKPVAPITSFGMMGGGISMSGRLEYGESWVTKLDMRSFVDMPAPGTYQVRVLYHDDVAIADESDISGLITCASLPIELEVTAIELRITKKELGEIEKAIGDLPTTGRVKLLIGTYGEEVHSFIAPDSAPGKILSIGMNAAPKLIELALDDNAQPTRRAWAFALLASLTDRNDPRTEPGVLGAFDQRDSGWRIFGGTPGELSGGVGFSSTEVKVGDIDPKKQSEFAKRWQVWKTNQYFKVEME